jgi:cell division protein FtsB
MSSRQVKRMIGRGAVWALIVLGCGIVFITAKAAWHAHLKEREAAHEEFIAKDSFDELVKRQGALTVSIENLSTERGVEAEVRKRFPVAKNGEVVFTLIDPKNKPPEVDVEGKVSYWQTVIGWFSF